MGKDNGYAILRLPSGEMRRVRQECRATVGVVGNADHSNLVIGSWSSLLDGRSSPMVL